jgi:hypothetical protein
VLIASSNKGDKPTQFVPSIGQQMNRAYICLQSALTQAIWQSIAQWSNLQLPPQNVASMRRWWHTVTQGVAGNGDEQMQVIIYTIWNIWKERCRRVFQNKALTTDQLIQITRQDILDYREANQVVE